MKVALYLDLPLDPDSEVPLVDQLRAYLLEGNEPLSMAPGAELVEDEWSDAEMVHVSIKS